MSEVSSEAVEAATQALIEHWRRQFHAREDAVTPAHVDIERSRATAALTAALPYLAAHQPARVAPSAEEVEEAIFRELVRGDDLSPAFKRAARTVLALFASQPTVAEVREQVARDIEAEIGPDPRVSGSIGLIRAARIARGETKGGE